jgi:hypothetical protein
VIIIVCNNKGIDPLRSSGRSKRYLNDRDGAERDDMCVGKIGKIEFIEGGIIVSV